MSKDWTRPGQFRSYTNSPQFVSNLCQKKKTDSCRLKENKSTTPFYSINPKMTCLPFRLFGPGQHKLPLSVCTNKPLLASTFCSPCRHWAPWKLRGMVRWNHFFISDQASIQTQQLVFIINSILTKGVYTKPPEIIEILIITSFMFAKWTGVHKFYSLLQIPPYPHETIGCCLRSQQKRATKKHLRPLGHFFFSQSHHSHHVRTTQWCAL